MLLQANTEIGYHIFGSGAIKIKLKWCTVVKLMDIQELGILMHVSMLSPSVGPRAYVEHLTTTAFPILGNLTKNLCPRVGTFAFFARRNGTKSHRPRCTVCADADFRFENDRCHF